MSAIVQQQVRPTPPPPVARNPLVQIGKNPIYSNGIPVVARHIPHHRRQSQLARRAQHVRSPRSKRRPEELHRRAGNLLQRGRCTRPAPASPAPPVRSKAADGSSCGCPERAPPPPPAAQFPASRAQNLPSQKMSRERHAAPVPPATAAWPHRSGPSSNVSATSSAFSARDQRPPEDLRPSATARHTPTRPPQAQHRRTRRSVRCNLRNPSRHHTFFPTAALDLAAALDFSSTAPNFQQRIDLLRMSRRSHLGKHNAAASVPFPCPARSHTSSARPPSPACRTLSSLQQVESLDEHHLRISQQIIRQPVLIFEFFLLRHRVARDASTTIPAFLDLAKMSRKPHDSSVHPGVSARG